MSGTPARRRKPPRGRVSASRENAAKFTPAGGCVNITASTDCGARQAVPRVADTGAGVAPDVVLCDIGLPGMDGYEVARSLRADPALAGTRLVALSGYALPEDLQRAAEAGFDRHIAKPPSPETLESVLAGA